MIRLRDFEPIEQVGEGGRLSFRARNRATGVPVLVHLFRGTSAPEGTRVMALLPRFPPAERSRILDFGQDQGAVFFITLDLPGNLGFVEWIDSVFHSGRTAPPPGPPPATPEPPVVRAAPPHVPPSPPPPAPALDPGDFTRFYSHQSAKPVESTTTTEGFEEFYRQAPASSTAVPPPREPAPLPRTSAEGPMDWLVHGEPGVSRTRGPARRPVAPELGLSADIGPLFAGAPARQQDPPRRRRPERDVESPPKYQRNDAPEPSGQAAWGPSLKPWLITMGIILGVALVVVLVSEYFLS